MTDETKNTDQADQAAANAAAADQAAADAAAAFTAAFAKREQLDRFLSCEGVTCVDQAHAQIGKGGKVIGRDYEAGKLIVQWDEGGQELIDPEQVSR